LHDKSGALRDNLTEPNGKSLAMDSDDIAPRKKAAGLQLGEDISAFSAHELEERIRFLEAEIARCKAEISARHATRSAAENFFRR
jgi:uncharacterized small protein (DUF1192 family)